jgi:hypothetical protein
MPDAPSYYAATGLPQPGRAPLRVSHDADATDWCVEDTNFLLDYFRLSADRQLIYGGGVVYGARDPRQIDKVTALLRVPLTALGAFWYDLRDKLGV